MNNPRPILAVPHAFPAGKFSGQLSLKTTHLPHILYRADFPIKKRNALSKLKLGDNKIMAGTFNAKSQFLLVVVLDKDQKALGKTGYQKVFLNKHIPQLNSFIK